MCWSNNLDTSMAAKDEWEEISERGQERRCYTRHCRSLSGEHLQDFQQRSEIIFCFIRITIATVKRIGHGWGQGQK